MLLNGSSLGINPLNGVLRTPVSGASEWLLAGLFVELESTRYQHGAGEAAFALLPGLAQTLIRFGSAEFSLVFARELSETVSRIGEGHALLETAADLYYTREVFGFGSAALTLELRGDVGVVFLDAEASMLLPEMVWAGARVRPGDGEAGFALTGGLTVSAWRRAEGVVELVSTPFILEPSHRDAADILWLGGFGERLFGLGLQDDGMLRQAFLGSMDLKFQAQGMGCIERPTLSGTSVIHLESSGDFRVLRRASVTAMMTLDLAGTGEVLVLGEGKASLQIGAKATAYKLTGVPMFLQATGMTLRWDGVRLRQSEGAAFVALNGTMQGLRKKYMAGEGVMVLLASSSAYRNLYAEDDQEQLFVRPGLQRDFLSPARTREWNRK